MDTDIPATAAVTDTGTVTRTTAAITDRRFMPARHFIGIMVTEFITRDGITATTGIGANRRAEVS